MCRAVNFVANAMIDGKTTPHEIGTYPAKRKVNASAGIDGGAVILDLGLNRDQAAEEYYKREPKSEGWSNPASAPRLVVGNSCPKPNGQNDN